MLRTIIRASLLTAAVALAPLAAQAQTYPDRPIRLVVPFPPGGGTDLSARMAAEYLSQKLGQSVVVENKPGAATAIGMDTVAKAKPDGYTLIWTTSDGMSILPAVKPNVPYKIPDDYAWVAGALKYSLIVAVNAKTPWKSLKEMLDYSKANPGKLRYSSSGVGAGGHLATELIANAAGVQMVHVPYQGAAPAVTGAVGGFVDLVLVATSSIKPFTDSGQLRALATTDTVKSPLFPEAPPLAEAGLPGVSVVLYYGMLAPAGTPEPALQKLRSALDEMLKDPKILAQVDKFGFNAAFLPGDGFKSFMINDLEKWKGVAKAANISIVD